jgi:hypothetical protein
MRFDEAVPQKLHPLILSYVPPSGVQYAHILIHRVPEALALKSITRASDKSFELRFERNSTVTFHAVPKFLEMHFKARTLLG